MNVGNLERLYYMVVKNTDSIALINLQVVLKPLQVSLCQILGKPH